MCWTIKDSKIVSLVNAWFVHFGPYVPMGAGKFQLTIHGSGVFVSSSAWTDIVSGKGPIQHAKFPCKSTIKGSGILVKGQFELELPVQALEIRVHGGEEDKITLEGYELVVLD